MEFRQRAPRDRLDQDGPLSEERLLPKVPCWVGETEREPRAAPSAEPALGWLTPATATSRAQAGEKQDAFGSPISLYKRTPPRTKTLGTRQLCSIQVPRHQASSSALPVVSLPTTSLATGTSTSSTVFYSKCCSPQPPSMLTSTWSQDSTPTLTASNILFSPSLSPCQLPNSIPNPSVNTVFCPQFSSPSSFF